MYIIMNYCWSVQTQERDFLVTVDSNLIPMKCQNISQSIESKQKLLSYPILKYLNISH